MNKTNEFIEHIMIYSWFYIAIIAFIVMLFVFKPDFSEFATQKTGGLIIDNSAVSDKRLDCVYHSYSSCGLYCKTAEDLEYGCLTNFRIVNK